MIGDSFEATFRIKLDRRAVWDRLTDRGDDKELWLPGFDATATITKADPAAALHVVKKDPPHEGTDIAITLDDDEHGTNVRVVQSGFGVLPDSELFEFGGRRIVADLRTYLATGVAAGRFARSWSDLGAEPATEDGGVRLRAVRPGGLADRLGVRDGDLLVTLANAPVTTVDELLTVLRVLDGLGAGDPAAEWVRGTELHTVG